METKEYKGERKMRTTVKRLKVNSVEQAEQYILKLRQQGRSAWMEQDGSQVLFCFRVQVVTVRVLANTNQNYQNN